MKSRILAVIALATGVAMAATYPYEFNSYTISCTPNNCQQSGIVPVGGVGSAHTNGLELCRSGMLPEVWAGVHAFGCAYEATLYTYVQIDSDTTYIDDFGRYVSANTLVGKGYVYLERIPGYLTTDYAMSTKSDCYDDSERDYVLPSQDCGYMAR